MKGERGIHHGPDSGARAFTIVEVIVAAAITAVLAGFIVATLSGVSGFWARTSGKLSAEAQGRFVLEQLAVDLQSALYRDDGNTWLAATIPANTGNTGLWDNSATTGNAVKPSNAAGSLLNIATGNIADARFGVAGTWLRFFTTKRGTNPTNSTANTTAANTSAPVAVGYQIVRRRTTATGTNQDRRYLLHRAEVRPAALSTTQSGTFQAGFDIAATAYQPASSTGTAVGNPSEIRYPTLNSVIAENVVDIGVRMHVYVRDPATGVPELRQIFPASAGDLSHTATRPPGVPNADGEYTENFPEVIDIMVRILTDEGARRLALYEGNPQRLSAPAGRTPQQYWWDLVIANSQVFTRRVVLKAKPL
jgi:type II secretory pathway pseudopilin PulG